MTIRNLLVPEQEVLQALADTPRCNSCGAKPMLRVALEQDRLTWTTASQVHAADCRWLTAQRAVFDRVDGRLVECADQHPAGPARPA